jgi:hypothetical protein
MNAFDFMERLVYAGTGNFSGTLSTNGVSSNALTGGFWAIWADEDYILQVNDSTNEAFGATPTKWPANFINYVYIQGGRTKYLGVKRVSTNGNYYANQIAKE